MSIAEDFKEFFGMTKEEYLEQYGKLNLTELRRQIYQDKPPTNDLEARTMYLDKRYASYYLRTFDDQFFIDREREAKEGYYHANGNIVVSGCVDNKPLGAKVLDYGCGHFIFGFWAYYLGYKVTFADIPHDFFRFMEFVCKKRGMDINFVPITGQTADLPEQYNYIINSEIMEHCWEPLTILRYLISKLKKYGLIYISDFYDDCQGEDPSHLKHNNICQDIAFKFHNYEACGIEPYQSDLNNIIKIWKKYE